MGAGFAILIFFLMVLAASVIVAIISGIITAIVARKPRKGRKVLLALVSPFIFFFVAFFISLFGSLIVADWKGFDVGIGDTCSVKIRGDYFLTIIDGLEVGYIDRDGQQVVSGVLWLQQRNNTIYGERYNGKYFSLDMANARLTDYRLENDFFEREGLGNNDINPEPVNDYFFKRNNELKSFWLVAVNTAAILLSASLVFAICRLALYGPSPGFGKAKRVQG